MHGSLDILQTAGFDVPHHPTKDASGDGLVIHAWVPTSSSPGRIQVPWNSWPRHIAGELRGGLPNDVCLAQDVLVVCGTSSVVAQATIDKRRSILHVLITPYIPFRRLSPRHLSLLSFYPQPPQFNSTIASQHHLRFSHFLILPHRLI